MALQWVFVPPLHHDMPHPSHELQTFQQQHNTMTRLGPMASLALPGRQAESVPAVGHSATLDAQIHSLESALEHQHQVESRLAATIAATNECKSQKRRQENIWERDHLKNAG